MANRKKPLQLKTYSPLALWMINAYGKQRLKMMRDEYEADLPHTMPKLERQQRIDAINEIFPKTKK